jgi:DNA-binding transcriptional regulator YiaG
VSQYLLEPGELVGIVVRTAYDLGMDVASAIMGIKRLRAPNGDGRTLTCADMARLRTRLGLAARQFAQIFGVELRTVQWCDAGECDPHPEQRDVVELVTRYVRHFGVEICAASLRPVGALEAPDGRTIDTKSNSAYYTTLTNRPRVPC